jgi:hypothetical protein
MDEQIDSSEQDPEEEKLMARPASQLACASGQFAAGKKKRVVLLTLGYADASIDQIALTVPEAKKVLYRLAVVLGHENLPLGPATEQKILRRWCLPHSVGRAELNVQGEEDKYLDQLTHDIPELGEYVAAQLDSLRRVLHRTGKGAAKPETLMQRVKRLVLIALDAGRSDT